MLTRRDRRLAAGLAVVAACATLIPYMLAGWLAPSGVRFGGFLLNPLDGFSYLAKMRQGMDGAWLFHLPYAPEPGTGVPLFLFYLLLGHIQAWTGFSPLTVFHAFRVVGAAGMFLAAFRLLEGTLKERRGVWAGYALILAGGGLGWLALPLGIAASDLTIPESVPLLTALVNPHFPLAAGFLILSMATLGPETIGARWRWAVAFLCGTALGVLLPFVVVVAVAVPFVWLVWEWLHGRTTGLGTPAGWLRDRWMAWGGLCLGASPWVLYGLWLTRFHPVLRLWQAQNQTPSPSPLAYLFGVAVPLALIGLGWRRARPERTTGGRLLLVWILVTAVCLYLPGLMQRRLSLGWAIPLAGLAGMSLSALLVEQKKWAVGLAASLLLTLPSLAIVLAAGLSSVAQAAAISVVADPDLRAMEWAGANLPSAALVLAGPLTGNRLPAFSGLRVLYGHPFETPNAALAEASVLRLINWQGTSQDALREARSAGVGFVYVGDGERALAHGTQWWDVLPVVYASDGVSIYQVSTP
jgi:hypothetical protein